MTCKVKSEHMTKLGEYTFCAYVELWVLVRKCFSLHLDLLSK